MSGVDLLFTGGDILTMAGSAPPARALAVDGGRVVYVGDRTPEALRAGAREVVDLAGRALVPGFHDAHVQLGLTAALSRGLDLAAVSGLDALGDLVRTWRRYEPDADLVVGRNLRAWAHLGALPDRADLDRIEPEVPLLLVRWDARAAVVNTPMMLDLAMDPATVGFAGGPTLQEKTGLLLGEAFLRGLDGLSRALPPGELVGGLVHVSNAALDRGVTTLHCHEGVGFQRGRETRALVGLPASLRVRLAPYHRSADARHRALGGFLAAVLDGPPGSADVLPVGARIDHAALERVVARAHRRGYQVAIGATGPGAVEAALRAFEAALAAAPQVDHRHRIDGCAAPTDDQVRRMADLGLTVVLRAAGAGSGAARRLLDRGILVAAGSGAPVGPIDPLALVAALTAPAPDGPGLATLEAFAAVTVDAARAALAEGDTGTLTPGKRADLVLLSGSPLSAPASALRVQQVWVDGQRVTTQNPSVLRFAWSSLRGRLRAVVGLVP